MEHITPDQVAALKEKRRQMFAQMGVNNAGQMMTESTVATGAKNLSVLQKIQQIKSGAAKSELNKYVNATSKGGNMPGVAGFDPIPEPSKNKPRSQNPNMPQQSVDPKHKVELDSFSSPSNIDNSELSMIDAMFGGGGGGMRPRMNPQANSFDSGQPFMQHRPQDMQLDLSNTLNQMPSFNPHHAIERAKNKAGSQYLQFAQGTPVGNPQDYTMQDPSVSNQMANMGFTPQMKMMMETIAKTMAEQTMRRVLSEFTEQQKNKQYFEIYNKEKSIIKTADGKLYKITPVQVKKH